MINPKITNCKECVDIQHLIDEINCKVSDTSQRLYNNIVFALSLYIDYTAILDLLNYRRILEYKLVDPSYVCEYTLDQLRGKIRLLTNGCKTKCPCSSGPILTTTTTTLPTTTTTTTAGPTTSTTTSLSTSTTSSTSTSTTTIVPTTTTTTTNLITTTTSSTLVPTTSTTTTGVVITTTSTTGVPTTTTTTTVSVHFWFLSGGKSSAALACAESTYPIQVFSPTTPLDSSSVLYTTASFTTVFNGGGLWYKAQTLTASYLVQTSGDVDAATPC